MDILCLHYYFPPLKSPAVIRNHMFSEAFSDFFEHVFVLRSDNHKHFPSLSQNHACNVHIHDIPTLDYRTLLGKKQNKEKNTHFSSDKKNTFLFRLFLKIQKSFPFNLFLAEGNLYYIFHAYQLAKKLIDHYHITTIYSSFGPYADHYIAYLLKKKYPHLRWIADFRDLQIEPIYKNVVLPSLQKKIEQKVLSKSDKIICISEGFVDQLKNYGRPTQSVFRGVNLRPKKTQFDTFTIAYTGSLYFEYRDPSFFLAKIKVLLQKKKIDKSKIQIIYAGRDSHQFAGYIDKFGLLDIFQDKGLVSPSEAKEIQDRAHINLLITSSSTTLSGVLTGKLFEYLEAQNPILCLINGPKDVEFERLFSDLQAGKVFYNPPITKDALSHFLLSKYNEWIITGKVTSSINTSLISSKYSWKNQASKILE